MDVNGKVHMYECVQMVINFKFHPHGFQLTPIVQLHSYNIYNIVNEHLFSQNTSFSMSHYGCYLY